MIDTLSKYEEGVRQVKQQVQQMNITFTEDESRKDFLFTAAAKNIFLPNLESIDRVDFFRECQVYKNTTLLDIKTDIKVLYDLIHTEGAGLLSTNLFSTPCIFCTFHFGAYQLLLPYLSIRGVDFNVVTKQEYFINEIMTYKDDTQHFAKKAETMRPNSWSILLDMSNSLREGKSSVVFLDRIEGVTNVDEKKNKLQKIHFLGHQLFVRRGIPEVSYLRGVPIIPVISFRDSFTNIGICFGEPINPLKGENKKTYTERSLQTMFTLLESYVKKYPSQWEYWPEVYSRLDLTTYNPYQPKPRRFSLKRLFLPQKETVAELGSIHTVEDIGIEADLHFNEEQYGMYQEEGQYYLFDTHTYNCFKISENLHRVLSELSTEVVKFSRLKFLINKSLLEEMVNKEVIVEQVTV